MATEVATEKAADPLRSLRRGLQRAEGFTLFVAVCNSPLEVEGLIGALSEAMPGCEVDVVRLDEKTANPLDDVLEQVRTEASGPVMILGLEKPNRSLDPQHPVLGTLNMSRPRWRQLLPRPVVLWVPEYLLGLLEREAPDFLDWRSDTFLFPEVSPDVLKPLTDRTWAGGTDGRMPMVDRQARIKELGSRLATTKDSQDPVVLATSAGWWHEKGNHLLFLGHVGDAEEAYFRSLEIYEHLDQKDGMETAYHYLGRVAQERGLYDVAFDWYQKALRTAEELGHTAEMAVTYHYLGRISRERGSCDEALEWYRKALRLYEELNNREGIAASYHQLGRVAQERGLYLEAVDWNQKALSIFEELGHRDGMAASYHHLGRIAQLRGFYDEALEWYRSALQVDEELGLRAGMADTLSQMSSLSTDLGELAEAVALNVRSLLIFRDLGAPQIHVNYHWLRRQQKLLGEECFRSALSEHLDEDDVTALLEQLDSTDDNYE